MIPIAEGAFEFSAPPLSKKRLRMYAHDLFIEADRRAALLAFEDYGFQLELEQGSLKGRHKLVVGALALANVIAIYGSVRSGIRDIQSDARAISEFVFEKAPEMVGAGEAAVRYRRSNTGALGRLNRLFEDVAAGKLTSDEATVQAYLMLQEYGEVPEKLREEVAGAIREIRLNPQQINIPWIEEDQSVLPASPKERPRPRAPKDLLPNARLKMRVQVRREHRLGPIQIEMSPAKSNRRSTVR